MTDETIFATALEKTDPAERAAYLAEACADAARRERINGLISAHEGAATFLEHPPVTAPHPGSANTGAPDDPDEALDFLAPPRRPDSLGRIGHYEVLEVLGRGGFGIVFRAFDDELQRVVAVKVLAPSLAATSPARKRFVREAYSSAKIRHQNVVQIHDVEKAPPPYLVMEFVPGESLQQKLDHTGPLELPEVLRIGRQLAEGLAAAHETGLVHRDVKPANVLIESGPQQCVKLTDFGLARAADDASLSQSGVVAGTPMYMAPEQAKGETLDHRADLFSLGSVLYVMCSGRPPFRANGALAVLKRVCDEHPRPIREVIPEVPEWFCRIVEKLHAKDPAERFQSAREVADLLADCERQLQGHKGLQDHSRIPGAGKPAPAPRHARRNWAVAALIVLLLGGLAWRLLSVQLVPEFGNVVIRTFEPDLVVTIDGQVVSNSHFTDITDFTGSTTFGLTPGVHRLQAYKDALVVYDESFTIAPGETKELTVPRSPRRLLPPTSVPPDKDQLQGKWVGTSMEMGGKFVPLIQNFTDTVFTGNRVVFDINDVLKGEGTFTLDPTRDPKEIDVVLNGGKGRKLGIYRLDDSGLTLCLGDTGAPRPKWFQSGDTSTALIMQRAPNAAVQPLKDALAAKTRILETVKQRLEFGTASRIDLLSAEAEVSEARIALAEAEGDRPTVRAQLVQLVKQRQEERDLIALRVEVGVDGPEVRDRADARVADAKARLAKVRPEPPAVAPAPKPKP